MKKYIYNILIAGALLFAAAGCNTEPEALDLQPAYKYTDEYYANLRAYKQSDHERCFVWFADYTQTNSMGYRFAGLPDSIDIVSLWGGYPDPQKHPIAYKEMWEMRNIKGTLLVAPTIIRIRNFYEQLDITEEEVLATPEDWKDGDPFPEWIQKFGDYLLGQMWDNGIDGLDLDYEPEGDPLSGFRVTIFVKYLGQFIGPMSPNKDKLLCIDFYSNYPPAETEPYANYFIRQAYTQGFTEHSATRLESYWRDWMPTEKFIVTENIGDWWANGGSPFTEADGNQYLPNGERLYSLEGMARWSPKAGRKGGFGAFYVQRDYNTSVVGADKDIPYLHTRRAIQWQNPAITK